MTPAPIVLVHFLMELRRCLLRRFLRRHWIDSVLLFALLYGEDELFAAGDDVDDETPFVVVTVVVVADDDDIPTAVEPPFINGLGSFFLR